MNKELHPRSDVARFYVSRKNGGRGLNRCKNIVKGEENGLGWYVKNNLEPLLATVRTTGTITNKDTVDPTEFKKTTKRQRKSNGLRKECMDNLLEIWRIRIQTTHGDGREKVI